MIINRKILIIDDDENILRDYESILEIKENEKDNDLDMIKDFLEMKPNQENKINYEIEYASQGEERYKKILNAFNQGIPFALVFLDMRMPPGWDGLKTAKKIRELDTNIEIVIVTAFADVPRSELVSEIGHVDKLLYLKKPFAPEEIEQLALNLTYKYYLREKNQQFNDSLKKLIKSLREIKGGYHESYINILNVILHHVISYIGAKKGIVAIVRQENIENIMTVGEIDQKMEYKIVELVKEIEKKKIIDRYYKEDQMIIFPLRFYEDFSREVFIFAMEANEEVINNNQILSILLETAQDIFTNYSIQKRYLENEKLALLGMFTDNILNEIKIPIDNLEKISQDICHELDGLNLSEKDKKLFDKYLDRIVLSKNNMLNTIRSIVDFSTGNIQLTLERVKISDFMNRITNEINPIINMEKIHFKKQFIIKDFDIEVDIDKVTRALLNIVSNGIQVLRKKEQEEKRLTMKINFSDKYLNIEIENNGEKIPENIRNEIFIPFKTYGEHKGTGLGLSITKQIIEAHKGELDFRSDDEKTVFFIRLPIKQDD